MLPLHSLILGKVKKLLNDTNILILCIDGPTAAGKTILADELARIFTKELSIKVDFFRLDWALRDRAQRENDLKALMQDDKPFYFEGELHMHLNKYKSFLEDVHLLKKNKNSLQVEDQTLLINSLYSRDLDGTCSGENLYNFSSKKNLIICEGHYTSRSEFRNLIDLNICLLAEKEELLERKINRVKSYRSPQAAIDYFNKIDIPSFSYHLSRFHKNIDLFVDNTNYENPTVISPNKIFNWFIQDSSKPNFKLEKCGNQIDFEYLYEAIFSSSEIKQFFNLKQFKDIFNLYKFLDKLISRKLQNNTQKYERDIQTIVSDELEILYKDSIKDKREISFEIVSSSSLHNVYQRKIPVSIGIKILGKDYQEVFVHYNININFIEILFLWDGGSYEIKIIRSLNNLEKFVEKESVKLINCSIHNDNYFKKEKNNSRKVLYTPTDFCVPSFIKDEDFNIVYTGREHELTSIFSICKKVITSSETIFCHRVSQYSELNFFQKLLETSGINCVTISNYLIGINSNDRELIDSFQIWARNWLSIEKSKKIDQEKYDSEIKKEIIEANKLVSEKFSSFIMVDTYLFEKDIKHELDAVISDLKNMLKSKNRIVRKRAFEYIVNDQNGLEINTKEFLSLNGIDSNIVSREKFPLADLPTLYPSIFAEIYLWLNIRGDSSAILGSNIYDIDKENSLDVEAILESAARQFTPIVLQSSFNALGQKEIQGELTNFGYLKIDNGSFELVDACIKSNFKNILIKGCNRTIYGIGLDHIDARNDKPDGRAKRFLNKALETGQITHIVLDGSYLFNASDRDTNTIRNAYKKVSNYAISLLDNENNIFLIDLEYCVGEMNYIGDLSDSMIPTPEEIRLFTNIVRQGLTKIDKGHFNCRPSLFIGNVGTTHHSSDNNFIDSSISYHWVEKVKDQNFISAVLHGTTNSNPSILRRSTSGCHKVNVAGDFLNVYQTSLPERFNKDLRTFNSNSKYKMPEIRKLKNTLIDHEKEKIISNIKNKTEEILKVINSPEFSSKDINYFHRSSFKFSSEIINYILSLFKESKKIIEKNKFLKANYQNISFSASMIEVPFEEGFMEVAQKLIRSGLNYFHIDVGDGNFISRKFSGIKKLEYLSSLSNKLQLHTHLMVKDPFSLLPNNKSYIDSYIESGATSLALHSRSFKNNKFLKEAIEYIKKQDCRPGIVIEVNQTDYQEIWNLISFLEINWVIIMGVPIGYGGQLFQTTSLNKINYLRKMSIDKKLDYFDIEIDGGLTFNNILDCFNSGANIFAGWSIIKDTQLSNVIKNYKQISRQLLI